MRQTLWYALRLALALIAGAAWSLLYPRNDYAANYVIGASFAIWLVLLLATRGALQARATYFAFVSVIAAFVAHTWSGLSWRHGVWVPELPLVLHRIFSTDGESSYNASDAQLFLVVLALLTCAGLTSRRVRAYLSSSSPQTQQ